MIRNAPENTPNHSYILRWQKGFQLGGVGILIAVLLNFGFSHIFRTWVSLLHKNPRAAAMTNVMCHDFPVFTYSKGTPQGLILFTIVLEPLAIIVRAGNTNYCYADDILLLSHEPLKSLPQLMRIISHLASLSRFFFFTNGGIKATLSK